jgi:hypothetical protein
MAVKDFILTVGVYVGIMYKARFCENEWNRYINRDIKYNECGEERRRMSWTGSSLYPDLRGRPSREVVQIHGSIVHWQLRGASGVERPCNTGKEDFGYAMCSYDRLMISLLFIDAGMKEVRWERKRN